MKGDNRSMIGFNALLKSEGIDPVSVRLVRHQDTRKGVINTPHQLWLANDGRFEHYQNLQSKLVFGSEPKLASFVVTPFDETLFIGIYDIHKVAPTPQSICPVRETAVQDHFLYEMTLSPQLEDYRGKVVVEWGLAYVKWVQLAGNQDKRIIEIRKISHVPPFPGFLDFQRSLSELKLVPLEWREILQATSGIYMLTHPETGAQYVGSAQGIGGFWGRWEQYISTGHGGNIGLIEIEPADYSVSILELVSPNIGTEAILRIEDRWKEKLHTRQFGLNKN